MAWFNEEIAGLLREYAELTQITGGDVFRVRNYEKAARSVRGWADDIGQLDVAACENPHVNVIGHPTTRRMGKRPPVEVDFGELFRACARTGTALEINASPQRLDLPSDHIRAARDTGVRFAIDSDAHSVSDLGNMPFGAGTAQRGWLTPDDVINTWPLDRLHAFLRKDR